MKPSPTWLVLLALATTVTAAGPKNELGPEDRKELARLQSKAQSLVKETRFEEGVKVFEQVVEFHRQKQGKNHWEATDARAAVEQWTRLSKVKDKEDRKELVRALDTAKLAQALSRGQKYQQAETLQRKAIGIYESVLGKNHAVVATCYSNLAVFLEQQGKIREALPVYQQSLRIRQQSLEKGHRDFAMSYSGIAVCLGDLGLVPESAKLHQEALRIRLAALGKDHPHTAVSYASIGGALKRMGKTEEALTNCRKALDIRKRILGEQHADTAYSYNITALCESSLGNYAGATQLHRKALAILKNLGLDKHSDTGTTILGLATCLEKQALYAQALPEYRKALALFENTVGERSLLTSLAHNGIGFCLFHLAKYRESLRAHQKALAIRKQLLGEQSPAAADSMSNIASCLSELNKPIEALSLYRRAWAVKGKRQGDAHPEAVDYYSNMASSLEDLGRLSEAHSLREKALNLTLSSLDKAHPDATRYYNGLAGCLVKQGKISEAVDVYEKAMNTRESPHRNHQLNKAVTYAGLGDCFNVRNAFGPALDLHRKVLRIRQQIHGENHLHTAAAHHSVARCLANQGNFGEALDSSKRALEIMRKLLGEDHPHIASAYGTTASHLFRLERYDDALPFLEKALSIRKKCHGEAHPLLFNAFNNLGAWHYRAGDYRKAADFWSKALLGYEFGRLQSSSSGFERTLYKARTLSPRATLADCLVRLGQDEAAWEHAESDLARGLLDDLHAKDRLVFDAKKLQRLEKLDARALDILTREKPTEEELRELETLTRERDSIRLDLAKRAVAHSRRRTLPLEQVQKELTPTTAVVFWIDVIDNPLGCVLRQEGAPRWVRLPGSGNKGAWTEDDKHLAVETRRLLSEATSDSAAREKAVAKLTRQRMTPLLPHLNGVEHLLVVSSGWISALPVELLAPKFTVSYIPSASVFAQQSRRHRALEPSSALVLADPEYEPSRTPPPTPKFGLLVKAVLPESVAARYGLRAGDVILKYGSKQIEKPGDLEPKGGPGRVLLYYWRNGTTFAARVPTDDLGVVPDPRPIAKALADWRKSRAYVRSPGDKLPPLPGTRLEASTLVSMIPNSTALLGTEASVSKLKEMADSGALKKYRLLHFATHGKAHPIRAERSELILSQHEIPTGRKLAELILQGKQPPTGSLTVGTVLEEWELDADLVVLSACQTGLGRQTQGSGMLGFTQALLRKGARTVVLSSWKVNDAATALLMARFYENLLGKREGLTKPMGRARALAEAKAWLRRLTRKEAKQRLAALFDKIPKGERGVIEAPLPTRKSTEPRANDRLFEHPYYWAAFVLIGDPN